MIPTFNRRLGIARTLEALARDSHSAPLEVVVVDDGSTDGTPDYLAGERFPFALQILRQQNSGPAVARNAGVERAAGELILFLDDDTEPQPGLVREHLATHGASRELVVMGPLGSLPDYPEPWVAWEQRQVEKQYRAMLAHEWEPTFRQFWTGNASLSREQLLAAGGFDPSFKRAEDVELGLRLHRRGLSFRFNPEARVLHHARRTLDSWCEMHRRYGALEGRIYEDMDHVLRGNWRRLRPSVRALLRASAGKGAAPLLERSLRAVLQACARAGATRAAQAPCSVLANVIFWDALARSVDQERFARIVA